MTLHEFAALVEEMRRRQRMYATSKRYSDLIDARDYEARVDHALTIIRSQPPEAAEGSENPA